MFSLIYDKHHTYLFIVGIPASSKFSFGEIFPRIALNVSK